MFISDCHGRNRRSVQTCTLKAGTKDIEVELCESNKCPSISNKVVSHSEFSSHHAIHYSLLKAAVWSCLFEQKADMWMLCILSLKAWHIFLTKFPPRIKLKQISQKRVQQHDSTFTQFYPIYDVLPFIFKHFFKEMFPNSYCIKGYCSILHDHAYLKRM